MCVWLAWFLNTFQQYYSFFIPLTIRPWAKLGIAKYPLSVWCNRNFKYYAQMNDFWSYAICTVCWFLIDSTHPMLFENELFRWFLNMSIKIHIWNSRYLIHWFRTAPNRTNPNKLQPINIRVAPNVRGVNSHQNKTC